MRIAVALILYLCTATVVLAERVALVIGNAAYKAVAPLDNPLNDAASVAGELTRQGFDVVQTGDLDRAQMREALRSFRSKADNAEIAMVYYAGHGIEIDGTNYLMPVDARLEDIRDAGLEMVEMDLVLRQISGASRMKMVVLDACRNNPFLTRMKQRGGARSVRQGLADVQTNEADTLIAYAAAAGAITPDGAAGGNSPFTAAFLDALTGPPTDVRQLLGRVRDRMRKSVPGAAPFVYSSLGGGDYVINPNSALSQPEPAPPAAAASDPVSSISRDFIETDRIGTLAAWNAFLVKFENRSDHPLYAFGLEKREQLKAQQPPPEAAPAPAVVASVQPEVQLPESRAAPAVPLSLDDAIRDVQQQLRDRGCYGGAIDGDFGRNSRAAWTAFLRQAGVDTEASVPRTAEDYAGAAATLAAHPDAECPAVARAKPPATTPKRKTPPKQSSGTTIVVPAPAGSRTQGGENKKIENSTGGITRRDPTKLLPRSQVDCIGSRAKFYDCD